jgi:hypothetical protein
MLIAVAAVAAIMAAISLVVAKQGRWTWEAQVWIVLIGIIPVAVNCLWWRRQYAKAPLLPYWYVNYTRTEVIVLLILVCLLVLGLVSAALLVMRRL